jgi:post-segregation antitoxin (ccd killing protein)
MARINIYLPDYMATAAQDADLDISALTRSAITRALGSQATNAWLATLPRERTGATHELAMAALDEARDEFGT